MTWIFFYAILLMMYVFAWVYSLHHPGHTPEIIARFSGLIALLTAFANALQKASLKVYFLFQRIAIRFSPDTTSRWWFSARYDGIMEQSIVSTLTQHFIGNDFRFASKIEREDLTSAQIEIDQTLFLTVQFEPSHFSEDSLDHLTVVSRVMEVSYGHAKKKIQQQIIPVLQAINDLLKADNCSFELDVQFIKKNPFFAVYIAHLRPEQVQDYRVVLHVDGSHSSGKHEKVEITKEKVHVTAKTPDGFRHLAEDFVLLSPDLRMLRTDR
ncbi:MAG TPA: hypothetical protein VGN44_14755 [Candidatus Angelobacter sp.]|jgi:hypothetical protein